MHLNFSFLNLQISNKSRLSALAIVLAAILVSVQSTVFAKEFQCSSGQDQRFIRMEYPGALHLCEVTVTRSDQSRKVMWYADHDSSFCSEKIRELVGKYQNQWGFSCEEWPDRDGIDNLSKRHRSLLDSIIKQTMVEAGNSTPPYTVLGTRALVGPLASGGSDQTIDQKAAELVAVQLFTTQPYSTNEPSNPAIDTLSPNNKLLFIRDDGEALETFARLDELKDLIEIEKEGYSLDSAIIEKILPGGQIEVSTLVAAPGDDPDKNPSCYGRKLFKTTATGLQGIEQHKFICDF